MGCSYCNRMGRVDEKVRLEFGEPEYMPGAHDIVMYVAFPV